MTLSWLGALTLGTLVLVGCREQSSSSAEAGHVIRGQPIDQAPLARSASTRPDLGEGRSNAPAKPALLTDDGFLRLGFDVLSSFPYDVYEYYSETNSGRPFLKSDHTIPASVRAYDGRRVTLRGFVLPLRLKGGKAIEFLLLRDQGTCCFGPQAKITHFVRVKFKPGAEMEQGLVYQLSGTIRVGEVFVQGYLTGLYNFEAEKVEPADAVP